jgi:hypothetical protein
MWEAVLDLIASSATFFHWRPVARTALRWMIAGSVALQPLVQMIQSRSLFQLVPEVSGASTESKRQAIMKSLEDLAAEQIRFDDAFLGKQRFSVDQQNHTLSYDLRPMPLNFVLSETDPLAMQLEVLIRVEALRRDFAAAISDERFWPASLDGIQQIVERCVSTSGFNAQSDQQRCIDEIDEQFEALKQSMADYATAHGFHLIEPPQTRGPVAAYRVHITIDPPRARVRVMTLLEYKKYEHFKIPPDQYEWSDLLDSEADMIGWYHYRAEWPKELNGPEEGNIEIKKTGTLTFRPTQK